MKHSSLNYFTIPLLTILAVAATGCNIGTSARVDRKPKSTLQESVTPDPTVYVLAEVRIDPQMGSLAELYFDKDQSPGPLSSICSVASSTPISPDSTTPPRCKCQFEWADPEATGSTALPLVHAVQTDPVIVQDWMVSCPMPSLYPAEIPRGSSIDVQLLADQAHSTVYSWLVGASSGASDFVDDHGRRFLNVHRYSCYDVRDSIHPILNEVETRTNPNSTLGSSTARVIKGNRFCIGNNGTNCQPSVPSYSVESNYYSLMVTSQNMGAIIGQNSRYVCPKVKEPLLTTTSGQFWPLDSQFALAQDYSKDFSVAVEGPSILQDPSVDGASNDVSCADVIAQVQNQNNGAGNTVGNRILMKCLGFAAKANLDGSCPSFKNQNGQDVPQYRLRRYLALYPVTYKSNGFPHDDGRRSDLVYIIDRPVVNPADPSKPYSMLGPKPCNTAYYDKHGLAGVSQPLSNYSTSMSTQVPPGYVATNDDGTFPWSTLFSVGATPTLGVGWSGKNPNGIHFPNVDRGPSTSSTAPMSCSATFPLINYDSSGVPVSVTLGTSHSTNTGVRKRDSRGASTLTHNMNRVWVRPSEPWAPTYIEDETFRACAPLSSQFRDPPLHFRKNAANQVAYCAETAPTQNPEISILEKNASNPYVKNYTSHVVKNSTSPACIASTPISLPTGYPTQTQSTTLFGAALHPSSLKIDQITSGTYGNADKTCDRTVVTTNGELLDEFPLLAQPQMVEKMLASDTGYQCTLTSGPQAGNRTPASCCAQVDLSAAGAVPGGHWEPSPAMPDCSPPTASP